MDQSPWDSDEDVPAKNTGNEEAPQNSWDSSSPKKDQWNSNSYYQETLVEPFRKDDLSLKDGDEAWDAESKNINHICIIKANEKPLCLSSASESLPHDSDSENNRDIKYDQDGGLLVVDLEDLESENDNTIWKIPSSNRSDCSESHFDSEVEMRQVYRTQRSSTYPNLKEKSKPSKKSSKSLEDFNTATDVPSPSGLLIVCEGSMLKRMDKTSTADYLTSVLHEKKPLFSGEFECRTVTIVPHEKLVDGDDDGDEAVEKNGKVEPGTSAIGEKSADIGPKEPGNSPAETSSDCELAEKPVTESWIFLDELGKSQEVTMKEVNILLGGRSADTVLQDQKEHYLSDGLLRGACSDVTQHAIHPIVRESLQFLCGDDLGGEENAGTCLGLERKVGNMLLYIRSRTDLTRASVRFISVDTGMVHMWRRSRDFDSSPLSSEADARIEASMEDLSEENTDHVSLENESPARPFVSTGKENAIVGGARRRFRNQHSNEYEMSLTESKRNIDYLNGKLKEIEARQIENERLLEGERAKNLKLECEVMELRRTLDKANRHKEVLHTSTRFFEKKNGSEEHETSVDEEELDSHEINSGKSSKMVSPRKEVGASLVECKSSSCSTSKCRDSSQTCNFNDEKVNKEFAVDRFSHQSFLNRILGSHVDFPLEEIGSQNMEEIINQLLMNRESNETIESFMAGSRGDRIDSVDTMEFVDANADLVDEHEEEKIDTRGDEWTIDEDEQGAVSNNNTGLTIDDRNDLDSLRYQVCNLKLELETVKSKAQKLEEECREKIDIALQNHATVEQWRESILNLTGDIERSKFILSEKDFSLTYSARPKNVTDLLSCLKSYIRETTCRLVSAEKTHFDRDEHYRMVSEMTALSEEANSLKAERDLLLGTQIEQHEKLKQTTTKLNEQSSQLTALRQSLQFSEAERSDLLKKIETQENVNRQMKEDNTSKDALIRDMSEKLTSAEKQAGFLSELRLSKEKMIAQVEAQCSKLLTSHQLSQNTIAFLSDTVKNIETEKASLESEISSLKESNSEMADYTRRLENLVENAQEQVKELKIRLKEVNGSLNLVKKANEDLSRQRESDMSAHSQTLQEMAECKKRVEYLEEKTKEVQLETEETKTYLEKSLKREREKCECLDKRLRDYEALARENRELKDRNDKCSQVKEELMKEQKNLLNEIECCKKDMKKVEEKYRLVKSECSDRTDLIRYLEKQLRKNVVDYNNRISSVEKNMCDIIEKISVCKKRIREKNVDEESAKILKAVEREKRTLEQELSDCYGTIGNLEKILTDRQHEVNELRDRLSKEQKKITESKKEKGTALPETMESAEEVDWKWRTEERYAKENQLLEQTVVELKAQVTKYETQVEIMKRNLSTCGKTLSELAQEKKIVEETWKKIAELEVEVKNLQRTIQEKDKKILESTQAINKYEMERKSQQSELENSRNKTQQLADKIRQMSGRILNLQESLATVGNNMEAYQKERDEMADKLLKSVKLIMEERAARQSTELLITEKEKHLKDQIEQSKTDIGLLRKEKDSMTKLMEESKSTVSKLRDDVKKWKTEVTQLRDQLLANKRSQEQGRLLGEIDANPAKTLSREQENMLKTRLHKAVKELKEIRRLNLHLRKVEGDLQAKIVCLEEEVRNERLLVKELRCDLNTEIKARQTYKNMIQSARQEVERHKSDNRVTTAVAEKIERYLNITEVQSREPLSVLRRTDCSACPECHYQPNRK